MSDPYLQRNLIYSSPPELLAGTQWRQPTVVAMLGCMRNYVRLKSEQDVEFIDKPQLGCDDWRQGQVFLSGPQLESGELFSDPTVVFPRYYCFVFQIAGSYYYTFWGSPTSVQGSYLPCM